VAVKNFFGENPGFFPEILRKAALPQGPGLQAGEKSCMIEENDKKARYFP
jgi:hypothetical protein